VSVQNHSVDILNAFLNSGPSESSNNLVLSFVTFGGALVEVAGLAVDSDGVGDIGRGAGAGGRADDVDGVHVPPLPCFRMATPVKHTYFFVTTEFTHLNMCALFFIHILHYFA
jgi:hypothetical protein